MHPDFYTVHPHYILFAFALMAAPRITLAFMLMMTDFVSGGLLWWLGYIFVPRLLIAVLSLAYWDTNPVLVVIAWMMAFSGESAEKTCIRKDTSNTRDA